MAAVEKVQAEPVEGAPAQAVAPARAASLVQKFAHKYSIEPNRLLATLKATAFRQERDAPEVTNEQMAALLVVADQYNLNPFTRELYAFADKYKGIVPIVSIDGWARIINESAELDGIEFRYAPETTKHSGKEVPVWIECVLYRKDRSHQLVAREFFDECVRSTGPWTSHPRRMLRHKALIQASRISFGFAGIYDQDEAERIIEGRFAEVETTASTAQLNQQIAAAPPAEPAPVQAAAPAGTVEDPAPAPAAALQDGDRAAHLAADASLAAAEAGGNASAAAQEGSGAADRPASIQDPIATGAAAPGGSHGRRRS